jgi:hypothetical protein
MPLYSNPMNSTLKRHQILLFKLHYLPFVKQRVIGQ